MPSLEQQFDRTDLTVWTAKAIALVCRYEPNKIQQIIEAKNIEELCAITGIPSNLCISQTPDYLQRKYNARK